MNGNTTLFLAKNLCGLSEMVALLRASSGTRRAIAACPTKSHGRTRLPNRNAKWLGLRDAVLRRWGKMGPDVSNAIKRGG